MKITRPTLFLTISCLILGKSYSVEWSYEFPEKWPGMCQTGRSQSPIDITEKNLRKVDDFEPFVFHGFDLTPDTAVLKNDGHTAAMDFSEGVDHHFPNFGLVLDKQFPPYQEVDWTVVFSFTVYISTGAQNYQNINLCLVLNIQLGESPILWKSIWYILTLNMVPPLEKHCRNPMPLTIWLYLVLLHTYKKRTTLNWNLYIGLLTR